MARGVMRSPSCPSWMRSLVKAEQTWSWSAVNSRRRLVTDDSLIVELVVGRRQIEVEGIFHHYLAATGKLIDVDTHVIAALARVDVLIISSHNLMVCKAPSRNYIQRFTVIWNLFLDHYSQASISRQKPATRSEREVDDSQSRSKFRLGLSTPSARANSRPLNDDARLSRANNNVLAIVTTSGSTWNSDSPLVS
jgi:hypothetical protein